MGAAGVPWYEARCDPTGLAPDPVTTQEAVIQVYAARDRLHVAGVELVQQSAKLRAGLRPARHFAEYLFASGLG
jgi:hypothetical protein